jgi:chitin disaccharide deacetylase
VNNHVQCARKTVLCADDYAISEGVSRAIINLVDAGRLTAVSAMTSTPGWREFAAEIVRRRGSIAIGLHLDLTFRPYGGRATANRIGALIQASLFDKLDVPAMKAEFERQFDAFEAEIGFVPDHVDGHHHVHVLPQVRDALLAVLHRRYDSRLPGHRPLVRDPTDSISRILDRGGSAKKALALRMLGAGFRKKLVTGGGCANDGFAGFSSFRRKMSFDKELDQFLTARGPRHLIMCHPGLPDASSASDALCESRREEYMTLAARGDTDKWLLRVNLRGRETSTAYAAWLAA